MAGPHVLSGSAHSPFLSESRLRSLSRSALITEVASAEMSLHAIYLHEVQPPAAACPHPCPHPCLHCWVCLHPSGCSALASCPPPPWVLPGPGISPQSLVPDPMTPQGGSFPRWRALTTSMGSLTASVGALTTMTGGPAVMGGSDHHDGASDLLSHPSSFTSSSSRVLGPRL